MGKVIETNDNLIRKIYQKIVLLRENSQGKNIETDIERPFCILSEEEKNKVTKYCLDQAHQFYTSNNDDLW